MIIPKYGDYIKHKAFMDVCFLVDKTYVIRKNLLKIKGYWWNQGFVSSFGALSYKETIEIRKPQDWLICKNKNAKCVRYEQWMPLVNLNNE